ncbi:ExeA family protein [Edaphobacter flagellatus]|uniref:ExeA family protein n=1 Tax=Edaphobacter flagellatus TaxID=1933044 RepID=UPI0021B2BE13|nr:AAA family ATPase [Edaphobacter flagellatus]
MYNNYFKLHTSPFGTSPDPRFLYMMPHTREALACLEYGISARKGFTVLTGEVGTGKTTLLKRALASFSGRRIATSFVFNPRLEVLDFLEFVLTDFGIVPTTRTKSGMLLQLNRWLIERFRMEETCVVVVDEAQNLSWELLEEIRLLTNLETSSEKLLQIVLSGQPELEEKLRHPSVRQLRQRVALWCRTQALTEKQTIAYVGERLRLAGATTQIFTPEALERVHRYSRGIPRIINLLCEHSLIVAYVEQVQQVTGEIVDGVAVELELETQPFLISSTAMGSRGVEPLRAQAEMSGLMTALDGDPKGRQDR